MKKITALLLTILFVFGLAGCAKQNVQFDIKVVNKITIFSGSTGEKVEITDASAVDHITSNFNSIAFSKDKSSKEYDGYAYQITWYDADGKQIELVTVMSATRISYNGYFYDAMEADYEIDIAFIENLMKPNDAVVDNDDVLTYLSNQYNIEVGDEIPKVILDTDMTFLGDDAFCLSLLVQADNIGLIDLVGVTITGGNSFVSVGTNAALRQLELWGRSDIPVYIGTDKPLGGFRDLDEQRKIVGSIDRWGAMTQLDSYVEPNNYHDLGKYFERKWGYSETLPQEKSAADFLVETVLANNNNVTIISVGSPISIALACQMNSEFAKNVKEIVYYGGILGEKGSYTPYADFNCFYDATAFKVCLNADFPKQIMVPHEVVSEVMINKTVYDLIERKGSTQISDFWVSNNGGLYQRNVNRKDSCADAIAAIVCLAPSTVIAYQESEVDIIDDVTNAKYGKLTINSSSENPNVSFVVQLDTNRYWNFATDLLSHVSVDTEITYDDLLSENSSN